MKPTVLPLFLAFFILVKAVTCREQCPFYITCTSSQTRDACPPGSFYKENAVVNGCCPGCLPLKGESIDEHERCGNSEECQNGLKCSNKGICEKDVTQVCEYYKLSDKVWNKTKYWKPECLADGTYAPKQCKGERLSGRCFCFDSAGNRIFGESNWSESESMTCGCSRLLNNIVKVRANLFLHCDQMGNFESLQCTNDVCWCASPKFGFLYAMMLPTEMMSALPCYNRAQLGLQYRRKCDSHRYAQMQLKKLLGNHGTKQVILAAPDCNGDGSYNRVEVIRDKKRCVFVNNEPLTEAIATEDANCNCAFDRHVHLLKGRPFFYDCQPNGNYIEKQVWDGNIYCVDSDGFTYSNDPKDCIRGFRRL